ncbi:MAG TPA: hypothetical protein VFJ02_13980 [Vicinamibacterales bacterium]|nr:hypothetical protein [Vicinamibacterales bacterium]
MPRFAMMALALAVATTGCGNAEKQRAADAAQAAQQAAKSQAQAAKAAEQGAAQAPQGLEQMAKGLEALAGGGNAKPVDPVSFRDLQTFFPDLDGWEKAKPTGERMTAPFAFSQAEVRYTKGDARIEMKLVDSGFNQLFLTPFAIMMQAGYEKETEDGYEKSTMIAGQPGWEKWNTEGKDGAVNAFVGKRFLLTVEGDNIDNVKVLHDIAAKLDMSRLSALK